MNWTESGRIYLIAWRRVGVVLSRRIAPVVVIGLGGNHVVFASRTAVGGHIVSLRRSRFG